jgi:tetratricopeptide (TPR) repeat protein
VSSWADCQKKLSVLSEVESDIYVMPDEIPPTEDVVEGGLFGGLSSAFFRISPSRLSGLVSPYIGNDLKNLPRVLRENLFACILSHDGDKDDPVRSGIYELKRRISLICLKFQADERGLLWNPNTPWRLEARRRYVGRQMTSAAKGDSKLESQVTYGDPVDLIPAAPSNWLPYDPKMTSTNLLCSVKFNLEDYEEYYRRHYAAPANVESSANVIAGVAHLNTACPTRNKRKLDCQDVDELLLPTPHDSYSAKSVSSDCVPPVTPDKAGVGFLALSGSVATYEDWTQHALDRRVSAMNLLHDTIAMLKDAGNKALQAGFPSLAARRYDQAIQYCAVVFMKFPHGDLDLFVAQDTDPRLEWTPLLKLLITTRLNLSMVLLKLLVPQTRKACEMASTALVELGPFVIEKGQICRGRKFTEVFKDDEPESTYLAAKELQAKAFFRLGSAQYEMGDFSEAVKSFEHSITSITSAQGQPETIVLRRLEEAKHASKRKARNLRKKFKAAFDHNDDGDK